MAGPRCSTIRPTPRHRNPRGAQEVRPCYGHSAPRTGWRIASVRRPRVEPPSELASRQNCPPAPSADARHAPAQRPQKPRSAAASRRSSTRQCASGRPRYHQPAAIGGRMAIGVPRRATTAAAPPVVNASRSSATSSGTHSGAAAPPHHPLRSVRGMGRAPGVRGPECALSCQETNGRRSRSHAAAVNPTAITASPRAKVPLACWRRRVRMAPRPSNGSLRLGSRPVIWPPRLPRPRWVRGQGCSPPAPATSLTYEIPAAPKSLSPGAPVRRDGTRTGRPGA